MGLSRRSSQAPGPSWVLALSAAAPELTCFLTDGQARLEHASMPWPQAEGDPPVLPPAIARALQEAGLGALRLQLGAALDPWAWESALDRACGGLCISRYPVAAAAEEADPPALDMASPLGTAAGDDPYWIHGDEPHWYRLAVSAQGQGRALVAVAGTATEEQTRAFRTALIGGWRVGAWLSAVAADAAAAAGLPRSAWRLYGDACFIPLYGATGTEWRPVTSVSIDLTQSTGLLHEWGAEQYAQHHAAFHVLCQRIVEEHHGRMDDPQGDDGLMAYFGLEVAQEDAPALAVRAAWALVNEVPPLGFGVRIGISTGRVAINEGVPFGAVIHLAARLQSVAPTNGIVVSERTHALLGSGVECEPLPEALSLRGFDAPQIAYRVRSLPVPSAAKWQRRGLGRFVGRQREMAALRQSWALACRERRGEYRCLTGEPGIGKTRLLQEFERFLRDSGEPLSVISLTGNRELQSSAFAALATALTAPAFAGLAALLPAAPVAGSAVPDTPLLDRRALLDRLVQGFLALCRASPLCLIADDAQWLDPSTIELLEKLRASAEAEALLLVVSLREDARGQLPGLETGQDIALGGLGETEAMDLIGSLTAAAPVSAEVRSFIAERSAGIPLFLEETVRMVGQLQSDTSTLAKGIPARLDDLLTVRLDALGGAKPLAQLASVLGSEFALSLWESVLAQQDEWIQRARAPDAWSRLLDGGVLIVLPSDTPRCRFRHALIRDAAYESLWQRDRQRLHSVVARVLEHPSTPAGAELRAHHLTAAGELEAAITAWSTAARDAAASGADRESLALSRHALALLAQLPETPALRQQAFHLHLLQAARCIALDGYGANSVEAAYQRAAALCDGGPDDGMRIRVDLGLEACYAMRGDLDRARALAEAAVRHTPWEGNIRLALQARWAWTNVVFHQGHLLAALDMADQCLARYEPSLHQPGAVQDPAVMFLCYSAWGLFQGGRANEARRRVRQAIELAQTLDHPFSLAISHGFAASIALFCGDHAPGLAHAEEAMQRCSAKTFQAWLAHAQIIRGRLRAAMGDAKGGLEDMEQGLALWSATGARITVATYMAYQAEAWLALGQPQAALDRVVKARQIAQRHGEHYHEAELLRLQGWARWLLRRGAADAEAAQALMRQALELARAQGNLGFALRGAVALARAWQEEGRADAAAALLEEALQAVPGQQDTADAREARALRRRCTGQHAQESPEGA